MVITWACPPPGQPRQARQMTTPTPGPIIFLTWWSWYDDDDVDDNDDEVDDDEDNDEEDDDDDAHLLAGLGLHHHLTQLCSSPHFISYENLRCLAIWTSAFIFKNNSILFSRKICSMKMCSAVKYWWRYAL